MASIIIGSSTLSSDPFILRLRSINQLSVDKFRVKGNLVNDLVAAMESGSTSRVTVERTSSSKIRKNYTMRGEERRC